jgi:hypothetical protein
MPLPSPKDKEKKSDFMSRCMLDLSKKGEFKEGKQRVAVCMSQFDKAVSEASVVVGEEDDAFCMFSEANKESKTLNKPFRTPKGPKKFSVYVKNEKGNVVKVNFGDPNMEIKRDDPARRKSFRARHNCDNPGPKYKARYWSCKQWRAGKKVEGSLETEYEWDGETLFDHDELLAMNPNLANATEEVSEAAKRPGRKSGAQTPAAPSERKRGSKRNPKGSAKKGGGKITFSEKTTNTLKEKVKNHNSKYSRKVTLGQLKRVYRRGAGAFSTSHRPNMSRHGWAMARVNTFLKMMKGGKVKESYKKADSDIARGEKSDSSLWENIRKKKERIKRGSGEKMRKKGDKGAPTPDQIKRAKG